MYKLLLLLISLCLSATLTYASGIGGGGSGVHGASTQLPNNIGIGVAPSAWTSSHYTMDIGTSGALNDDGTYLEFISNAYHNGSSWIYKTTGYAHKFSFASNTGDFVLSVAPSGTAGNTASFSNKLTIDPAGKVSLTDAITSSKACSTGYTRTAVNYCKKSDDSTLGGSLTRDTCVSISVDSSFKTVDLYLRADAKSNNSAAARDTDIAVYSDSGCSVSIMPQLYAQAYEFSAVTAGTTLATLDRQSRIYTNGASTIYAKMTDDTGNQGAAYYQIIGGQDM